MAKKERSNKITKKLNKDGTETITYGDYGMSMGEPDPEPTDRRSSINALRLKKIAKSLRIKKDNK